jgi:hypothetical protein
MNALHRVFADDRYERRRCELANSSRPHLNSCKLSCWRSPRCTRCLPTIKIPRRSEPFFLLGGTQIVIANLGRGKSPRLRQQLIDNETGEVIKGC